MKKLMPLLCIAYLLANAPLAAQEPAPIKISIKKSDLEGNEVPLSAVADQISYIKLDTNPDALIGDASRYSILRIPDGYLIWNGISGNIMAFDSKGEFATLIGREGKGPGEYYSGYRVQYDRYQDNILVLLRNNKVLRYDTQGGFITSVDIDTNDSRIDLICVKDESTWLFTYRKPIRDQLHEVGVLATNKEGKIIKQYNFTDEDLPGSYGTYTQLNYLSQWGDDTYYSPYNYNLTYRLNNEDNWEPYVLIDDPFKKAPLELFKVYDPPKVNQFQRENGHLQNPDVYGRTVFIRGATPLIFGVLHNLDSSLQLYTGYDKKFKKIGFSNDIDGGIPFRLKRIYSDGVAIEMVDAFYLTVCAEKGLLNVDGTDHGPHMNLKEVLETTKPDDNPILVVVHIKD